MQKKPNAKCKRCGYEWFTRSKKQFITCPNCTRKTSSDCSESTIMCFWCLEKIEGKPFEVQVKRNFCHPSYWKEDSEYGYVDKTNPEIGYLFECQNCHETEYEGYDFCEYCNCLHADEDLVITDYEEYGFICRDCWLEQKGFRAKQKWSQTDAWRGHQTVETEPNNTEVAVECCVIGHEDNEEILRLTLEWLDKNGFEHIHYTERTSNIFSVNLIILAKKEPMTEQDCTRLKKLDQTFVDYYTRGFSVFSGETYRIDLEGYKKEIEQI